MRSHLRRAVKVCAVVAGTGCTALLLKHNDWEVSTLGVFRFGRAAYAACRIAADYKFTLYALNDTSPDYQEIKNQIHLRSALRLRDMCCANGGVFIKVGQHIGALDYLLPKEYVKTMKVLHNDAPQSPVSELYKVIKQDLGKEVHEVFTDFEPKPLGAASLAQVHKAKLPDGTIVAVKVQHPKVKAHSFVDIKTMEMLIHAIALVFPGFQYLWLAEETKKNLPKELDFILEGENCERVARLFKHFQFLKVPKIYWNYSTERILTMEYCEGGKADDKKYMDENNISVNEVCRNLGKLYSEMIFVQGYVHCDPHPGNVLVKQTSHGPLLVLLDHGLYQTLTDKFRVNYCKLWMSMINADVTGIKHYAEKLNVGEFFGLFACMLTARSWDAVASGMDKQEFTEAEGNIIKANAARYFIQISHVLNRIPRQMLLILKTNDVLRGIESSLSVRPNATSFINMSKCCVRAVAHHKQKKFNCLASKMFVKGKKDIDVFKLKVDENITLLDKDINIKLFDLQVEDDFSC